MCRILFSIILAVCVSFGVFSQNEIQLRNKMLSDSINKKLPTLKSSTARINALYDIFDLAPQDSVVATGERVLQAAMIAKDYASALDMLRRLSSFNIGKDSTLISKYMGELKKIPISPEREATECFIYLCAMTNQARYSSEADRFHRLTELTKRYRAEKKSDKSSVNTRIVLLFTICNYLDMSMPGEIMTIYLEELEKLLKNMDYRLDGLENMFYLHSAMAYTYNDQPARAVAADRELMKVIDRLDHQAQSDGRKFRNYDRFRYSVYRRMLINADALSPDEIEETFRKITELRDKNQAVADDMAHNPRAEASYLMAKGRYTQAVPLLENSLQAERAFATRRLLLRMLVKAAAETENKELLTQTAIEYNQILENTLKERTLQRGQELRVLYDVTDDSASATASDLIGTAKGNRTTVVAIVAIVLLLLATILFIVLYRRTRKISDKLLETNDMLTAERDNMQRTQTSLIEARDEARKANRHKNNFISNMSHEVASPLNAIVECSHILVDNANEEKRHYLDRFARTIDVSAEMLRTLINDVLEISNAEAGTLPIQRTTVPLRTLCVAAMENARLHLDNPRVTLRWANENEETQVIYTDARRVEQVLVNMLLNSIKFTEDGFIELAYKVDTVGGTTTFTVTDSGIGVPEGKEELIFERFEKLSPMSQGAGLGLSICRMIADLMKGKIYVDTSYEGSGARFVFTIPSTP